MATLKEQLDSYDIKAGDLIEFADGEIWRLIDGGYAHCLKGRPEADMSYSIHGEVLNIKTIKRVMRVDWEPFVTAAYDLRLDLTELKPKSRKKLVTVEIEGDFKIGEHLGVCVHPTESRWLGKVVEVREK